MRATQPQNCGAAGDSDPLDGLSPAQIVKFMEQHGIDPSDPLEVSAMAAVEQCADRISGYSAAFCAFAL